MLDINIIRENPKLVKEGVSKKGVAPELVDELFSVDKEWRKILAELETLRAKRNEISKELSGERSTSLLEKASEIKEKIKKFGEEETVFEKKRKELLMKLPNTPFEDVPVGKDESGNVVVREKGKIPEFDFEPKDHIALGESLGIIDVKRAAGVSGARFNYLLGDAALLEFALIRLAFDVLTQEKFKPVVPPVLAKPDVMRRWGKGGFIDDKEAFVLADDELVLVGSSEHTIGPFHMDETFEEKELPLRYVCFSSCFRREAGSYGKDTKGILRVHQFDKVEMFSVAHPEKSENEHRLLVSMQEKIMDALELPHRVVEICTGDMTWVDARQFDVETWIPSQKSYRETNSASNTTDYQSRGINARYKTKNGKTEYVHMLNATAIAIGRVIVAIMENNQTKKGTIKIPKVLQEYVGKKEIV